MLLVVKSFENKMRLAVYCDGGARGNPGPAAIGFAVYKGGKRVKTFSEKIGEATNNVAEYEALLAALKWIRRNQRVLKSQANEDLLINFFLDSELVSRQLRGIYKVKDAKLKKLIIQVKNLERQIGGITFYHYIERSQNKLADSLVNQTLGKKTWSKN